MFLSKLYLLLAVFFFSLTSCKGADFDFSAAKMLIVSNGDPESIQAADYLFKHLGNRNVSKVDFEVLRSDDILQGFSGGRIYMEIVPDLAADYEINNQKDQLSLYAKDKATLQWLSYMLMDELSHYHRINVADLPPNYIEFKTSKVKFGFEYREPHLLPNLDQDISGILHTHNVDRDWGLWGHNFRKVFVNGVNPNSQALVNNKRVTEQFCFSAEETYQAVRNYVLDQYGNGEDQGKWFMISPNDNDLVCTCTTCQQKGNTSKNATPAVSSLLNRLGKEFPSHHFYTTAYRTTSSAPTFNLLTNTGVFLSTVDIPKQAHIAESDVAYRKFTDLLDQWKQRTSNIFLWDYISNFDDYLTPFPVLYRAQSQLNLFKKRAVSGVFFNGSGYDYSPFDDIKTYVLSAIMIKPDLSVPDLIKKYTDRFYPVSGELICNYLIDLESNANRQNLDINMYTDFRKASQSYLDIAKFVGFYEKLIQLQPNLSGEEKLHIDKLIAALSYTQLQVAYHQGSQSNGFFDNIDGKLKLSTKYDLPLQQLKNALDEGIFLNYKEESGALDTYIKEWEQLKGKAISPNMLRIAKVEGLDSGEKLELASLLYDNKEGFSSDFNQGWFLTGEDISVSCGFEENQKEAKSIQLTFLLNKKHRMVVPDKVELINKGKTIATYGKSDFVIEGNLAKIKKDIPLDLQEKVVFKLFKNKELKNSVIVCDEIQFN